MKNTVSVCAPQRVEDNASHRALKNQDARFAG